MRKPIIAGNWKMYKTNDETSTFVKDLIPQVNTVTDREIVVCPPFTSLQTFAQLTNNTNLKLGAQNVYWEKEGAYTGEISPLMLVNVGCNYVIIGHSERRQYFNETDETVNKKIKSVLNYPLIPIVCIGETLSQREKNETFTVISTQVKSGLTGLSHQNLTRLVIAYEPVWAIGTGKTATPAQAQEIHSYIRNLIKTNWGEQCSTEIRILYGGSVKPDNIDELMKQPDIDGGLVGGASLTVPAFTRIIKFT